MDTPPEAVKAYGTATILATCQQGKAFEKEKIGWCIDDITARARPTDAPEEKP
jgi:hypothetical protein